MLVGDKQYLHIVQQYIQHTTYNIQQHTHTQSHHTHTQPPMQAPLHPPTRTSTSEQQPPYFYFCYLYISQTSQSYICFLLLLIGLFLLIWAALQYRRSKAANLLNFYVSATYLCIAISVLCQIGKIVASEVLFFGTVEYEDDEATYSFYSRISKYLFCADIIGLFAMQTSILFVPTNWLNNISQIFKLHLMGPNPHTGQTQRISLKNSIKFQNRILSLIKIYQVIRAILLLFSLFSLLFVYVAQLTYIMFGWFILEAFVVLLVLVLAFYSLNANRSLFMHLKLLTSSDIQYMKSHYLILIVCSSIRLATELQFTVVNFYKITKNDKCYIDHNVDANVQSIVNIIMQSFFTHYLAIFAMLRIYNADDEQQPPNQNKNQNQNELQKNGYEYGQQQQQQYSNIEQSLLSGIQTEHPRQNINDSNFDTNSYQNSKIERQVENDQRKGF